MAIPAVNGEEITRSNAYKYYYAYKHGDKYHMNNEQVNWCKSLLTPDQIKYCETTEEDSKVKGSSAINTDGAGEVDENGNFQKTEGRGGTDSDNKAMTYTGVAATGLTVAAIVVALLVDGFSQLALSIVCASGAAINMASALMMDGAYEERKKSNDVNPTNVEQITTYDSVVQGAVEEIKENQQYYQEVQNEKTDVVGNDINNRAQLEIQLHDAELAGDTAKAKDLREQLQEDQGTDTSGYDEEMQYYRERTGEAKVLADEAGGAKDVAHGVANFLEEGQGFVPIAKGQGIANQLLGGACSMAALGTIPKIAPLFPDGIATGAAKFIFMGAAAIFGVAGSQYNTKASTEAQYAESGKGLNDNCKTLGESVALLNAEADFSDSAYDQSDNSAAEVQNEVQQAADGAVSENTGTQQGGTPVNPNNQEEEDPNRLQAQTT